MLALREEGFSIFGCETTAKSESYVQVAFPRKTALVLGNEVTGVDPEVPPRNFFPWCSYLPTNVLVACLLPQSNRRRFSNCAINWWRSPPLA